MPTGFETFGDMGESQTQQMPHVDGQPDHGSKLQKGVGFTEFASKSEVGQTEEVGLTESMGTSEFRTEPVDDAEEVLVLLPDDESQQIPTAQFDSMPTEACSPVNQIEEATLRTTNPHHEDAGLEDEYEDDDEGFELGDAENVGVIDEIAALATSLDQDILNSDELQESIEGDGDYQPDFDAPVSSSGGSRAKVFVSLTVLAALALVGVYFYPTLAEKYFPNSSNGNNGEKVALANGTDSSEGSKTSSEDASGSETEVLNKLPAGQNDGSVEEASVIAFEEKLSFVLNLGLDH